MNPGQTSNLGRDSFEETEQGECSWMGVWWTMEGKYRDSRDCMNVIEGNGGMRNGRQKKRLDFGRGAWIMGGVHSGRVDGFPIINASVRGRP